MSYTETHIGKLRKVEIPTDLTLDKWCLLKCTELGIAELGYFDSWKERLIDATDYNRYFFADNGDVWESIEHEEFEDYGDIDFVQSNPDETISYVQQFDNGGTCLSEAIENALNRLNK